MSALCQIITVYSAKHGIIRCITVKISNESEAGKATGISSICFLGTPMPSKYQRPSLSFPPPFFLKENIVIWAIWTTKSNLFTSSASKQSLCLKRKHPCGSPAALNRKDLLLRRPNFLPITHTAFLSSRPEAGWALSGETQGLIANTYAAGKSVEITKSHECPLAPTLSGELCSPHPSLF